MFDGFNFQFPLAIIHSGPFILQPFILRPPCLQDHRFWAQSAILCTIEPLF